MVLVISRGAAQVAVKALLSIGVVVSSTACECGEVVRTTGTVGAIGPKSSGGSESSTAVSKNGVEAGSEAPAEAGLPSALPVEEDALQLLAQRAPKRFPPGCTGYHLILNSRYPSQQGRLDYLREVLLTRPALQKELAAEGRIVIYDVPVMVRKSVPGPGEVADYHSQEITARCKDEVSCLALAGAYAAAAPEAKLQFYCESPFGTVKPPPTLSLATLLAKEPRKRLHHACARARACSAARDESPTFSCKGMVAGALDCVAKSSCEDVLSCVRALPTEGSGEPIDPVRLTPGVGRTPQPHLPQPTKPPPGLVTEIPE